MIENINLEEFMNIKNIDYKNYFEKCKANFERYKKIVIYGYEKDIGLHAQSLSFATILTLVPIFTIFLSFLASSSLANIAVQYVNKLFKENLFPQEIINIFTNYIITFSQQASELKTISIIFFIVSILLLFLDLEDVFNKITGSNHIPRPWYKKILILCSFISLPIIVFIGLGITELMVSHTYEEIKSLIDVVVNASAFMELLIIIMIWFSFAFVYKLLPRVPLSTKSILIGATSGTVAFFIAQKGLGLYLSSVPTYQVVYGVFSVIPVFLLWIYINWTIILYGLLLCHLIDTKHKIME